MQVLKRNGKLQNFDIDKIKLSIEKASDETGTPLTGADINMIANDIKKIIITKYSSPISVKEIQNIVVFSLINTDFLNIAYHYNNYKQNYYN